MITRAHCCLISFVSLLAAPIARAQAPVLVGSIRLGARGHDVAVSGSMAIVSDSLGLQTVDVRNPAAPQLISTAGANNVRRKIAVSGTSVSTIEPANDVAELWSVDSTSGNIRLLSRVTNIPYAYGVAMGGDLIYRVGGDSMRVLRVQPSAAPVQLSVTATPPGARCIVVDGTTVCVLSFDSEVAVYDVQNPAAPVMRSRVSTRNGAHEDDALAVRDTLLCAVSSSANSLLTYDLRNPALPVRAGHAGTRGGPHSVGVSGDVAWVVNYASSTLQAFDISNPRAPQLMGTTNTEPFPYAVAVHGRTAYVTTSNGMLQLFQLPAPTGILAATAGSLTLAPNPAREWVEVTGATGTTVTVVDAVGRCVRSQLLPAGSNRVDLDLRGLPAGVYTVRAGRRAQRLLID